ncbi:MAG: hypothetical protein SWY16_26040 [Cyanobacteriota bacterium]|nr:hypothetical protein [Cyanobacteriota bacterium]
MNWTNDAKKEFRELLISIYQNIGELEMFVADSIDKNLANITQASKLDKCAFDIIQRLEKSGELDDFFNYFFEKNKDNQTYGRRIKSLQSKISKLVQYKTKILSQDWESLFTILNENDLHIIAQSCKAAFKDCFKLELKEIYPDCPKLDSLPHVRQVLEKYDKPELAVAFANRAIGLIAKLEGDARDTSAIADWREQIAQIHAVDPKIGIPVHSQQIDAYLLVALRRQGGSIHLLAELHRTGEKYGQPIDLDPNNRWFSCTFSDDGDVEISQTIAEPLSRLIEEAELRSDKEITSFTLEFFLPPEYLDLRVHEWEIIDGFDKRTKLGEYCPFIVRSLERAMNPRWLQNFNRSWMSWSQNISASQTIARHCIDVRDSTCEELSSGNVLINKIGVKLAAGLPEDRERRNSIFWMLIKSHVPVTFWIDRAECCGERVIQQVIQDFNGFLTTSSLNNFSLLAREIQKKRIPGKATYHLGMLCDCPERIPTLPSQPNIPRARPPGS